MFAVVTGSGEDMQPGESGLGVAAGGRYPVPHHLDPVSDGVVTLDGIAGHEQHVPHPPGLALPGVVALHGVGGVASGDAVRPRLPGQRDVQGRRVRRRRPVQHGLPEPAKLLAPRDISRSTHAT